MIDLNKLETGKEKCRTVKFTLRHCVCACSVMKSDKTSICNLASKLSLYHRITHVTTCICTTILAVMQVVIDESNR